MEFVMSSDTVMIMDGLGEKFFQDHFAGKTILITGGGGFLGRYVTKALAAANLSVIKDDPCRVLVFDNGQTSQKVDTTDRVDGIEFFDRDILETNMEGGWEMECDLQTAHVERIDYVLHMAGIASPFYYRKWPLETLDVATTGLRHVLDFLYRNHPDCRLLFFSSSEIYGDPDDNHVPTKESYRGNVSCLGPRACYDESKRLGETLIKIYQEQYGLHGMIVRPFNVYGPGMQKTDYRVLPNFASKILSGQPVHVYGNGYQTRTFCYITDAIQGFLRVLTMGQAGEPYNIGNPSPEIAMNSLVDLIDEILPYGNNVERIVTEHPDTYPADEPQRRCPDITKARMQVGYEPTVSLKEGLTRFFDWARQNY